MNKNSTTETSLLETLVGEFREFRTEVYSRFDVLEKAIALNYKMIVENRVRIERLEERVAALEVRMEALEKKMDVLEIRIDALESELSLLKDKTSLFYGEFMELKANDFLLQNDLKRFAHANNLEFTYVKRSAKGAEAL